MGKLYHGALGRVKGSVGNTTYRRIYGVANASAVYDKVLEVANPRTGNQILQRAKMPPAQKFYEAFKSVLDHSRQGLQAGEITRRAFMSDVMKMRNRFPFVTKGFEGLVAGEYPVSKGTLPEISTNDFATHSSTSTESGVTFDLVSTLQSEQSVDVISANLLQENPERLQVGDELTFLFIATDDYTGKEAYPIVISFVLDTDSTEVVRANFIAADGVLKVVPTTIDPEGMDIVAAACIHSRKIGDSWVYSKSTMKTLFDYWIEWQDAAAYNAMMQSYGAAGYNSANSTKILKQATNQPFNGSIETGHWYSTETGEDILYRFYMRQVVDASKTAQTYTGVFVLDGGLVNTKGETIYVGKGESRTKLTPGMIGWTGPTKQWLSVYQQQAEQM